MIKNEQSAVIKKDGKHKVWDLRTVSWGDPDKEPAKWINNYVNFIRDMNYKNIKLPKK